ncbi:lysophospholipid acyltransferase family protein [Shimia sp. FJ5]|uniref:lysophospholipid acyltransferase family protein n=1 Tax=Shimia sp. FJ5 TaxID=3079054 RepID=UPI0026031C7B|nr:lysophospholipid acyltransferase family protein [Shimia sp. FJ5]MDV4144261.1 lysophospholipid acyltransferase family protein [Shimia sp. FJ5]
MNQTWTGEDSYPQDRPITAMGWLRVVVRGAVLIALISVCLVGLLLIRFVEKPVHGLHRPWTPFITQFVCRNALRILGIGFRSEGTLMTGPGAVVANHSSWLDIFTLNARKRIYFVSKAEVADWPGIGWLAKATGTVFINRNPKEAQAQKVLFEERLLAGHKLLFFPEGTSTDAIRVLPFKPTLFAAFFSDELRDRLSVQPVTVLYHAPEGEDERFYGWWGDMGFGPHVLKVLAQGRQGRVEVIYHTPLKVSEFANRKTLALASEEAVRGAHSLAIKG